MVEFLTLNVHREQKKCACFFIRFLFYLTPGTWEKTHIAWETVTNLHIQGIQRYVKCSWPMKFSSMFNHTHTTPSTPPLTVSNTGLHPASTTHTRQQRAAHEGSQDAPAGRPSCCQDEQSSTSVLFLGCGVCVTRRAGLLVLSLASWLMVHSKTWQRATGTHWTHAKTLWSMAARDNAFRRRYRGCSATHKTRIQPPRCFGNNGKESELMC